MSMLDRYGIEDIKNMSNGQLRELHGRLDLSRIEDLILARAIRQELRWRGEADTDDNAAH